MKPILKLAFIFLAINVILFSEIILAKTAKNLKNKKNKVSKHKQLHLIRDNNRFESGINHVVRRDPTVSVVTRLGAERLEAPSTIIHTSNSNTNNGPNIGFFGRTAETVGISLFMIIFLKVLNVILILFIINKSSI
jgi:hypothetical protein